MEFYRPRNTGISENYYSEIAFVNTLSAPIVGKKLFYVQTDKFSGYYHDKNDYLKNLYWDSKKNDKNIKDLSKGYINELYPLTQYFSYVKIIRDKQNPNLQDKIMIFKFGTSIMRKIENYFDGNQIIFDKNFAIVIKLSSGFPNFDESGFVDYTNIVTDTKLNLDLEPLLKFKTITLPLQLERKEKLEKLNTLWK